MSNADVIFTQNIEIRHLKQRIKVLEEVIKTRDAEQNAMVNSLHEIIWPSNKGKKLLPYNAQRAAARLAEIKEDE